MSKNEIHIPASPSRLIGGLSDLSYSLQSSICDIIDNSISHGKAKNIFVLFQYDYEVDQFEFLLYDNGLSMDFDGLKNAMKLGSSDENYDPKADLGKYGMGLKTASLAHSNRFSLIAQTKGGPSSLVEMNKELIIQKDTWLYINKTDETLKKECDECKGMLKSVFNNFTFFPKKGSFTLLKWDEISELNKRANKYKVSSRKDQWIDKTVTKVESHIRMVFNRFLDGKNGLKPVKINYNGNELKGWDPCQPKLAGTEVYKDKGQKENSIHYSFSESSIKDISITRYIVSKNRADKDKIQITETSLTDQTRKLERWQGIYIYRNNRLIDYGTWLDNTGSDPHVTYARAEMNLTSEHDSYFRLNVDKTRISKIDHDGFLEWLKPNMTKYRAAAKKVYGTVKKKVVSQSYTKDKKVIDILIAKKATEDAVEVKKSKSKTTVTNTYGSFFIKELTSKQPKKTLKDRITSDKLGNDQYLWEVLPDLDNTMTVKINELNKLYKLYYEDMEKNKKIIDVINAFLLALSYAELSCKSSDSEDVFENIRLTVGDLLNKLIENKVIK
jgi:hypothetical protein